MDVNHNFDAIIEEVDNDKLDKVAEQFYDDKFSYIRAVDDSSNFKDENGVKYVSIEEVIRKASKIKDT